jgi:hypothetical protein
MSNRPDSQRLTSFTNFIPSTLFQGLGVLGVGKWPCPSATPPPTCLSFKEIICYAESKLGFWMDWAGEKRPTEIKEVKY